MTEDEELQNIRSALNFGNKCHPGSVGYDTTRGRCATYRTICCSDRT
jgi:hypothetical protein